MGEEAPNLGARIRARRKRQGLTLEALAEHSGVSAAMLSEVERSVKNPTVKLAWQVARALGCSLTELLDDGAEPVQLVRADERTALVDSETGVERRGVRSGLRGALEVAWYRIPAGSGSGEMAPNLPDVLEHVVVLKGHLELRLGVDEYRLHPGDHITYGPQSVVEYRSDRGRACEFLLLSDRTAGAGA